MSENTKPFQIFLAFALNHLLRPAYKNLTHDLAANAVNLCNDIISGDIDLIALNRQSLKWRGKFLP